MEELRNVRGMPDILGDRLQLFHSIRDVIWKLARCYGYAMIDTPILEYSQVFCKTLGETSDVVNKETYTFLDRDKYYLTMRPEFTASIVRALITNGLTQTLPQRFFSYGPLFRHERPQKARYRQFYQVNCEFIGANGPNADLEMLVLISTFIERLGLQEYVTLEINTLGDYDSRLLYRKALAEYFSDYKNKLSEENRDKIEKNPLRILDTKIEEDKNIVARAPQIADFLNDISKDHYNRLLTSLNRIGISYIENPKIVRGLDYYTHTVFEFTTDLLGTQSTVVGGGRYDKLVSTMGGPDIPAIGFACGVERLAGLITSLQIEKNFIQDDATFFVLPIGDEAVSEAFAIATMLRNHNFKTILEYGDHVVKKLLQRAEQRYNADKVIIIGQEEMKKNEVKLRDMHSGIEENVLSTNLISKLKMNYKKNFHTTK